MGVLTHIGPNMGPYPYWNITFQYGIPFGYPYWGQGSHIGDLLWSSAKCQSFLIEMTI
jgi:hypothetical protein